MEFAEKESQRCYRWLMLAVAFVENLLELEILLFATRDFFVLLELMFRLIF